MPWSSHRGLVHDINLPVKSTGFIRIYAMWHPKNCLYHRGIWRHGIILFDVPITHQTVQCPGYVTFELPEFEPAGFTDKISGISTTI